MSTKTFPCFESETYVLVDNLTSSTKLLLKLLRVCGKHVPLKFDCRLIKDDDYIVAC